MSIYLREQLRHIPKYTLLVSLVEMLLWTTFCFCFKPQNKELPQNHQRSAGFIFSVLKIASNFKKKKKSYKSIASKLTNID